MTGLNRKSHLFTLDLKASRLVDGIPKRQKSKNVSDAIIWYLTCPTFREERDPETGVPSGKLIQGPGAPSAHELFRRIENMGKTIDTLNSEIIRLKNELDGAKVPAWRRWFGNP